MFFIFPSSLYPFVLKQKRFPVGHPVVVFENFKPLDEYFGIAKVKILPPRKLYHPVLPYVSNGKLKFPLCRTCADDETYPCNHLPEQRAITSTWCLPEILEAMKQGYVILNIYYVCIFL